SADVDPLTDPGARYAIEVPVESDIPVRVDDAEGDLAVIEGMPGERTQRGPLFEQGFRRDPARRGVRLAVGVVLQPALERCVGLVDGLEAARVEKGLLEIPEGALDFALVVPLSARRDMQREP